MPRLKRTPGRTPEALRKAQTEQVKAALEPLRHFVDASYAGAAVPRPLKAFLTGQARALERPHRPRTYLRRLEDVCSPSTRPSALYRQSRR